MLLAKEHEASGPRIHTNPQRLEARLLQTAAVRIFIHSTPVRRRFQQGEDGIAPAVGHAVSQPQPVHCVRLIRAVVDMEVGLHQLLTHNLLDAPVALTELAALTPQALPRRVLLQAAVGVLEAPLQTKQLGAAQAPGGCYTPHGADSSPMLAPVEVFSP